MQGEELNLDVVMSHSPLAFPGQSRLTRDYLSDIMSEARGLDNLPAITVSVMDSKNILFQEMQGVRVTGKQTVATLDDYFHIGSCSKSVLALIAENLVEQKKISWNTHFFDLFPELTDDANELYHDISLEDLFLCKAGIKAYTNGKTEKFPEFDPSVRNPRLEFIKQLISQPPASKNKHGKFRQLYSNASYTMASAMLETVTGRSYEDLVTKTLTDDLNMKVHIGWPNSFSADQPWGHHISNDKIEALPPGHEYRLPCLIAPAGDLSLTPRDYAIYTQLHLRGLRGENNYISSKGYQQIHFGHTGFSLGIVNGALGGKRYSGFDGSAGTFFCRSIIVPESDFAFSIITNAGSGTGTMKSVDWLTMQIVKKQFNWWWKFWL